MDKVLNEIIFAKWLILIINLRSFFMVDGMLENFEGLTVDLENKGYKIELYNRN